jgi:hypothetical protein
MSERILALLLRLYPAELRRDYGCETLQLIRDRWRDEQGILVRLRLCLDLAADLLVASLRSRRCAKPLMPATDAGGRVPSFQLLERGGPRPEALVAGVLLSIVMMATFTRMMALERNSLATTPGGLVGLRPGLFQSSHSQAPAADSVDSAMRHTVIEGVAASLEHYVNPAIARQLANAVLNHEKNGDYEVLATGPSLADRLTQHIREASRAAGIPVGQFVADVIYSARPLPPQPPPPGTPLQRTPEALEQYRSAMMQQNCLFEKVDTLPHNIGYVKGDGVGQQRRCAHSGLARQHWRVRQHRHRDRRLSLRPSGVHVRPA